MKELLINGDFEQESTYIIKEPHPGAGVVMPSGWDMNWTFPGYAELVRDEEIARSGKQCLIMQYRPDPERENSKRLVNIMSVPVDVNAGRQYLVRIWVKGGFTGKQFYVSFYEYGGKKYLGYVHVKPQKPVILSDKWQFFEAVYEPRNASVENARLAIRTVVPDISPQWIDDISMRIYDGLSLSEIMKTSVMEKERTENEKLLSGSKVLENKYMSKMKELYSRFDALSASLPPDTSPELLFETERKVLVLLEEYARFAKDLKVDSILLP